MKKRTLDALFNPRSVAVIGASTHPRKVGHVIYRNFAEGKFRGKVFPVNPNTETLFGTKSYPSVTKIPDKVDLAVIAIPAKFVVAAIKDCGKKKIPAAIIVTSGFSEIGNKKLEESVKKALKKSNMRAIGVNCLGVFDAHSGVFGMPSLTPII